MVPSLPGMITVVPETPVAANPDRTPETAIVSSPSAMSSGLTVRRKVVDPVDAPAEMEMAVGAVAVKSLAAPSSACPASVPPATVTAMVTPPAGAITPALSSALTVMVSVWSAAFSETSSGLTRRTAESGMINGSVMVKRAGTTAKPAARPEMVNVSASSVSSSPRMTRLKSTEALVEPAGMVKARLSRGWKSER